MRETAITVDVYCTWVVTPQSYRVYVDDTLLTERTYIWRNNEQYVQENILVNLSVGQHQFRLEPTNGGFEGFKVKNFTVDNVAVDIVNGQFIIN